MWSYLHRRRINNIDIHYDKKNWSDKDNIKNFMKNFKMVNNLNCKIVNLLIPKTLYNVNSKTQYIMLKLINKESFLPQLDYARDYHHFDIKTSKYIVNLLKKKINNFDK
jgi:hypothetical protein